MDAEQTSIVSGCAVTRRGALDGAAALATAMDTLELVGKLAFIPHRRPVEARVIDAGALPDIQFDVDRFIPPAQSFDSVPVPMPPVHTVFLTARLLRRPARADQAELDRAMNTLEANYPFSAGGLITFVAYGLPYFRRLPSSLVTAAIPRLRTNTSRFALEEAVPSRTDVSAQNPGISKLRFNLPVRIEDNDLLFTLRSDNQSFVQDAISWLAGSDRLAGREIASPSFADLLTFTSSRAMFTQIGLPKSVASEANLPFQRFLHRQAPRWLSFADQAADASGPAPVSTFVGTSSARLTTSRPGDYFDHGGIQHLSHAILDLEEFFDLYDAAVPGDDAIFFERVQHMFGSPAAEQLTNGGAAFRRNEMDETEHRTGHLSTLQRSTRATDGRPIHIRMDGGPGFDDMDVPGRQRVPKLQFTVFVPTAESFERQLRHQACIDLQQPVDAEEAENGLERFLTATRRQNFLAPPRRHRSFPLVEFI